MDVSLRSELVVKCNISILIFFVDIVNILGKTRKEGGVATCEATICAGLRKYW